MQKMTNNGKTLNFFVKKNKNVKNQKLKIQKI